VKISWPNYLRNEDVLLRVKEQRNILQTSKKKEGHLELLYFA
jgi:hypothetical protein